MIQKWCVSVWCEWGFTKIGIWFGNKENEIWMGFPWLPVNATLVVWSAEELHLLKGDGAGEAAGNGRMKGKKRVKRGGSCKKSMTPLHQAVLIKY